MPDLHLSYVPFSSLSAYQVARVAATFMDVAFGDRPEAYMYAFAATTGLLVRRPLKLKMPGRTSSKIKHFKRIPAGDPLLITEREADILAEAIVKGVIVRQSVEA